MGLMDLGNAAAEVLLSSVSAILQAMDIWLQYRNRRAAAESLTSQQRVRPSVEESYALSNLVPSYVLDQMTNRVEECWSKYYQILIDDKKFLPDEVDNSTKAVKNCICRELARIKELNAMIPNGILKKWWDEYCDDY